MYPVNLIEGEGIGATYEYFAKWELLRSILAKTTIPQKILVAGIPGKYGLSLDFILLAEQCAAEITVLDERTENICRLEQRALSQSYSELP